MNPDEALSLLKKKLTEHGLAQKGWEGSLDSAVRRFGICRPSTKEISISRTLCAHNSEEEVLDTILHEIAHALVTIETGEDCGHDERWKAVCRRIGARPERCYDDEEVESPVKPWLLVHKDSREVFSSHRTKPKTNLDETYIRGRKKETLGKLEMIPNPEFQALTHLDRETALFISEEIKNSIATVCKKHGLQLSDHKIRYNSSTLFLENQIIIESQDGLSPEQRAFGELAPIFGLSVDDYRREFVVGGKTHFLVAIKPRNRTYPIIGETVAGKRYKFSPEILENLL